MAVSEVETAAVIAGHFGFAAAVKSYERQVPLWALMLATVWLDIIFVPLFLTGIETLEEIPGSHGGYGTAIIHADYTHSLLGALGIAAVFGGVAAIWWGRRTGFVLAAMVFSHWVLDLVVHRADMPILPGNAEGLARLGFGLWKFPLGSMLAELALVLVGAALYWRAARETVAAVPTRRARADLSAALVLAFGVLVLAMDVLS